MDYEFLENYEDDFDETEKNNKDIECPLAPGFRKADD